MAVGLYSRIAGLRGYKRAIVFKRAQHDVAFVLFLSAKCGSILLDVSLLQLVQVLLLGGAMVLEKPFILSGGFASK